MSAELGVNMADSTDSKRQAPDVPGTRSPALEALHVFVGTWSIEMTHVALPDTIYGQKTYEWLEGHHFLIERGHFDHPDVPDSVAVIGADDAGKGLAERYFDSRGVSRVYKMNLSGGDWNVWRDEPGFSQRFTGKFSDDGKTIEILGELCRDGAKWEHDCTYTYTKN